MDPIDWGSMKVPEQVVTLANMQFGQLERIKETITVTEGKLPSGWIIRIERSTNRVIDLRLG